MIGPSPKVGRIGLERPGFRTKAGDHLDQARAEVEEHHQLQRAPVAVIRRDGAHAPKGPEPLFYREATGTEPASLSVTIRYAVQNTPSDIVG